MIYIMKKLFIATLAIAALASCNNDQVINFDKYPINFGDAFVDNSVRATDPSYGTGKPVDHFNVYGMMDGTNDVNIYAGALVTKNSHDYGEVWDIAAGTPVRYWVDGVTFNFAAVVDADGVATDANDMPTGLTWTAANQKDMLYDYVSYTTAPADGLVKFTFEHLLSKINFVAENTTTSADYTYTITNIAVTNAITKGVYNTADGLWTTTTTGSQAFGDITTFTDGLGESASEVLFVPGIQPELTVTYNISFKGTQFKTETKTFNNIVIKNADNTTTPLTLEANKAYNFKVSVGLDKEIKFTATANVGGWENEDNVTVQ